MSSSMEFSFLPLLTESDWVAYGVRRGIEALCAVKRENSSQQTILDRGGTRAGLRDHEQGGTITGDHEERGSNASITCDKLETNGLRSVPEADAQQECRVDSVAQNFVLGHPLALLLSRVAITTIPDNRQPISPLDWGGELPCASNSSQRIETAEGEALQMIYGRGTRSTKDDVSNRGPCSQASCFEGLQRSCSSNCRELSKTREALDERNGSQKLTKKSDPEYEVLGTRWLEAAWKTLNLSSDTAVQKQRLQTLEHRAQTGAVSVAEQERKHCALLEREKERVKRELKAFDQHFARIYGKPPAHANKEPLRPLYTYYRRVKAALAQLQKATADQDIDGSQPGRPRSAEETQERSRLLAAESGNQEQEHRGCENRRGEEGTTYTVQKGSRTQATFFRGKEDNRDSQREEYECSFVKRTPGEETRWRGRSSQQYDRRVNISSASFEHSSGGLENPSSQVIHTASTGGSDVTDNKAGRTSQFQLQKNIDRMEGDVNGMGHPVDSRVGLGRLSGQPLFASEKHRGSRNASLPATRQSQRNIVVATRKASSVEIQTRAVEPTRLPRLESAPPRANTMQTRNNSGEEQSSFDPCRQFAVENRLSCGERRRKACTGRVEEPAAENLESVYDGTSEHGCFEEKLTGLGERTASLHTLQKESAGGNEPQSFRLQKRFLSWETKS